MRNVSLLLAVALLASGCKVNHDPPMARAEVPPTSTQAPTPTPTSSPAPRLTATPTPTPTPSATPNLGEEVTARAVAKRCLRYIPLVERWNPDFNLPVDLVLAVMAQESHCLQGATDSSGAANSVGLMQVIPASWTTTEDRLRVASINVYWGMRILYLTLNDEEHNPTHDEATALRAYNCDWREDGCGTRYANRVLTFWRPYVVEAMKGGE